MKVNWDINQKCVCSELEDLISYECETMVLIITATNARTNSHLYLRVFCSIPRPPMLRNAEDPKFDAPQSNIPERLHGYYTDSNINPYGLRRRVCRLP
jgi:hypothetical protein